jgi:hypothetical protein
LGGALLYASQLAEGAVSVWFISWAVRRRYELDYKLTSGGQIVRWSAVVAAFGLTLLRGPNFEVVRILAGLIGIAFLSWPNLAHHTIGLVERLHLTKGG